MTCPPCTHDCREGRLCPHKDIDPYTTQVRNQIIEEVAQHVEKLKGFGVDTVSSLAIYIRKIKK